MFSEIFRYGTIRTEIIGSTKGMEKRYQGHRIKVLFFIPWLGGGGAERTFLNVINTLDCSKFEPLLVLCRKRGSYLRMLKEDVSAFYFNLPLRFSVIPLIQKINKLEPDIIISTMRFANLVAVLARKFSGRKPRAIVRETNNLSAAGINPYNFLERLVSWGYQNADKVVSLSNGVRDDMIKRYGLAPDQIITIYNPIDINQIRYLAKQEPDDDCYLSNKRKEFFDVIGAGKLSHQKGFDILIKAISKLKKLPIRLTILGEGSEREHLLNLIRDLELEDRVHMPGFKLNPYAFMARSDLFVLSSRWEGFGHVIVEAMGCGVAVLSAKCPSGPDEIITDDIDGCLCQPNSEDDLAFHIGQLLNSPNTRKRYADYANETVKRFDVKLIVKEYEKLFLEIVSNKVR